VDTEALPPVVTETDTGGGLVYPILSGTAEPGATITAATDSPSPALLTSLPSTVADEAGRWSLTVDDLPAGPSTLSVVQRDLAGNVSEPATVPVHLRAPYGELSLIPARLEMWGVPFSDVVVEVDGERFGVYSLNGGGYARESNAFERLLGAEITIRYSVGERLGPRIVVDGWFVLAAE
jgi:hypothetical protein